MEASVSNLNQHEMDSLGHQESTNLSTRSSSDASRQQNGQCTKVLICFLALVTLTMAVASCWFVARFSQDGSINSAVWSFFTGAVSCGITSLFVLHLTQNLTSWHDRRTLNSIKFFGMLMSAASIIGTIAYVISEAVARRQGDQMGEDLYISALFSGLCLGSSFLLYLSAQWYQNNLPLECEPEFQETSTIVEPRPCTSHAV